MLNAILLFTLFIQLSFPMPPFSQLQGFGTDTPIKIFNQVIATNELSLQTSIKSNTYIRINTSQPLTLKSVIWVKEVNDVIIEGPATLVNFGIYVKDSRNVILHNMRVLNASIYGVLVYGSSNVVINSMTILDASRGSIDQGKCIDITEEAVNVTVSKCILGYTNFSAVDKYKGMLIANFLHGPVNQVSVHHNIFYQNYQRSPEISTPGLFDFRNNIVYGFTEYGSRIRESAYGNFQGNYYIGGKKDAMVFVDNSSSYAFARDNHWKFNYTTWQNIQEKGNKTYEVPHVDTFDYSTLLSEIQKWGCQPETSLQKQVRTTIMSHSYTHELLTE